MVKLADSQLAEEISVYARISVDTERESDSNTSIENQLKIINSYVKQHFPRCTVKEYVDRDKSGYTFEERARRAVCIACSLRRMAKVLR